MTAEYLSLNSYLLCLVSGLAVEILTIPFLFGESLGSVCVYREQDFLAVVRTVVVL